jgi:hypothetical protein
MEAVSLTVSLRAFKFCRKWLPPSTAGLKS